MADPAKKIKALLKRVDDMENFVDTKRDGGERIAINVGQILFLEEQPTERKLAIATMTNGEVIVLGITLDEFKERANNPVRANVIQPKSRRVIC